MSKREHEKVSVFPGNTLKDVFDVARQTKCGRLASLEFLRVRLEASPPSLPELADFYRGLGLEGLGEQRFAVGATEFELVPGDGEPFYLFALLVPGDRFEAAREWAEQRVQPLPGGDIDRVIFDFDQLNALACYFLDPAGNIVELIAHRGVGETGAGGPFAARELLGFSELALVGDPHSMARELEPLGLRLWAGILDEPGQLAFVGEKARTLILAREGRGWIPTGRPAEEYPVEAVLSGPRAGEAKIGLHRISRQR